MADEQTSLMEAHAKVSGNARETSRLAALRAAPRSGSARRKVLASIVASGVDGMTDDEIARAIPMSPNTVRPRRLELVEGYWVVAAGEKRPSDFGNPAIVWCATPKAIILIKGSRDGAEG